MKKDKYTHKPINKRKKLRRVHITLKTQHTHSNQLAQYHRQVFYHLIITEI